MDKFLIAPYDQQSGLRSDLKPFEIPDNAFAELHNAYVFRNRLRKRFGSRYMSGLPLTSRLRVRIGTTDVAGAFAGNVQTILNLPPVPPATLFPFAVGQIFSVATEIFTIVFPGPANMIRTVGLAACTFDTTTGALNIVGATPLTALYFYPALPVMGLLTADVNAVNNEFLIGFDRKFAYRYVNGWERLANEAVTVPPEPFSSVWNGSDTDFYWGTTWFNPDGSNKIYFVTNNNQNEPNFMRWLDLDPAILQWHNFRPKIANATVVPVVPDQYLDSARLLIVFHNRLVAFNTWEGPLAGPALNYCNRARYNTISSPVHIDPITGEYDSYNTSLHPNANAVDAGTSEAIITAEFVKDRLIVYFERSTWELAYTSNDEAPFSWFQINSELGAESTHSIVPFDKVCLGVGQNGIHACNGANTERIDEKIPDEVFRIHNADGAPNRVYGIRDFYTEMVYWTFPDDIANAPTPYPVRVLVYNYKNATWSFNDDSITCFGYYQPLTVDDSEVTWDSDEVTWDSNITWGNAANLALNRAVLAGNQQGFTFIIDRDTPTNAAVIQITNLTIAANIVTITAINHNFRLNDYVYFTGVVAAGNTSLINDKIFQIIAPPTQDTFQFTYDDAVHSILVGAYVGGGLISRVSKIHFKTKEFNFYTKQLKNAYVSKVDFLVDRTSVGEIQVNFYDSTNLTNMTSEAATNKVIIGTGILDTFGYHGAAAAIPLESTAQQVWHPVYFQAEGNVVQFEFVMNDTQMKNTGIRLCDFQLHAMAVNAMSTTNRIW